MDQNSSSQIERRSGDSPVLAVRSAREVSNLSDSAVNRLREHLLLMGGEVERAIDQATRALIDRDSELAFRVLQDDDRVDLLELEADQLCVDLLSMPYSHPSELRLVVTAIKITPILERIADHACNIARAAIFLNNLFGYSSSFVANTTMPMPIASSASSKDKGSFRPRPCSVTRA
jgi:hypothetical protein